MLPDRFVCSLTTSALLERGLDSLDCIKACSLWILKDDLSIAVLVLGREHQEGRNFITWLTITAQA
jgi:hypothetical protein